MPKPQRRPEEIKAVRENILTHAVRLMTEEGYHNFSMRKLAKPLGIAAKTIYNYFRNKDELYLAILTKGFADLYDCCFRAYKSSPSPLGRMDAMLEAFLSFGLDQANVYNLMFTWHVPKYNDYIGTPMEAAARAELDVALRVADLFTDAIRQAAAPVCRLDGAHARFLLVHSWSQLHGYVAGVNNHLLDYMSDDPVLLKHRMQEQIVTNLNREFQSIGEPYPGGK